MKKTMFIIPLLLAVLLVGCGGKNSSETSSKIDSSTIFSSDISDTSIISSEESSSSTIVPSSVIEKDYIETLKGEFYFDDDTQCVSSLANNSLAVVSDKTLSSGTLTVDITPRATGDNGIVFKLDYPNATSDVWEGEGIGYYFFFISLSGTAYLGKTSNGRWTACSSSAIQGYALNKKYKLSVSIDSSDPIVDQIFCYVDDKLYVNYADEEKLVGNKFGYRSGTTSTEYSYFEVSNEIIKPEESDLDGMLIANGDFIYEGGCYKSTLGNSIAYNNVDKLGKGTLSVTMKNNAGRSDNGLIFGLTENRSHKFWEVGVSYYFFFVNLDGLAFLGLVNDGTWANLATASINGYSVNATYRLRIERTDDRIKGYINDVLYINYEDYSPLPGTCFGIRAGSSNCEFSDIEFHHDGEFVFDTPTNYDVISGSFISSSSKTISASSSNSVALCNDQTFSEGSLNFKITCNSTNETGVIFKADAQLKNYYKFVVIGTYVYLYKIINGVSQRIDSSYISAGYSCGMSKTMRIMIDGNKIYCFFSAYTREILHVYFEDGAILSGNKFGFMSTSPRGTFANITIDSNKTFTPVDTLVFGHSYMEMWTYCERDLTPYYPSMYDLGIGGSIASQWLNLKEEIVKFAPKKGIYAIGINDLTGGIGAKSVCADVKELLLYIKQQIPEFEVCLLSTNKCPTRENLRTQIAELNNLYKQLAASYDWIYYGDMDEAFCDSAGNPIASMFKDGLHPADSQYSKFVDAINAAFRGENQPNPDDYDVDKEVENAKKIKIGSLDIYCEQALGTTEFNKIKDTYNSAINKINACKTLEEVNSVDLSSEITTLKTAKKMAGQFMQAMKNNSAVTMNDGYNWTFDQDGYLNIFGTGLIMDKDNDMGDVSFNFELKDNASAVGYAGFLFRTNVNSYGGVDGYLINYVTTDNYIQIWYLRNQYTVNTSTVAPILEYIGGWVYPKEVENTVFRASVIGNKIYVTTQDKYVVSGIESGIAVDLTFGGKYQTYSTGHLAVVISQGPAAKVKLHDVISSTFIDK